MSVYESVMQGLTEAVDYQRGKIHASKTRLIIKPFYYTILELLFYYLNIAFYSGNISIFLLLHISIKSFLL